MLEVLRRHKKAPRPDWKIERLLAAHAPEAEQTAVAYVGARRAFYRGKTAACLPGYRVALEWLRRCGHRGCARSLERERRSAILIAKRSAPSATVRALYWRRRVHADLPNRKDLRPSV
jgi:hypothetical protein